MLSDGGGLYIKVYPNGRLQWVLRKTSQGRAIQVYLGDYPDISLKDARVLASAEASRYQDGRAGLQLATPMMISELFADWLALQNLRESSKIKYVACYNMLRPLFNRTIDTVTPVELKALAIKIQAEHGPTSAHSAAAIMARLEKHAYAMGLIETPRLQFYKALLPPCPDPVHFRSVASAQLPELFAICAESTHRQKQRYLIYFVMHLLTLARPGEIISLKWDWINLETGIITWPASIMKKGVEHRTPICSQLECILAKIPVSRSGFVFPNKNDSARVYNRLPMQAFITMGISPLITPHGIRSLGRSWLAEEGFDFVASEYCLAHRIENATQRAYQRTDYLDQRRAIMQAWGDYVERCARPYFHDLFCRE